MPKCVLYILSPQATRPGKDIVRAIEQANTLSLPFAVIKIVPTTQPESETDLFLYLLSLEHTLSECGAALIVMVADEESADRALQQLDPIVAKQASHATVKQFPLVATAWTTHVMSVDDVAQYAKEVWSGQRINCL